MKRTSRKGGVKEAPAYVLDAYAVLCYLQDEAGADEVGRLLEQARTGNARLLVTWMNLGEVYYRVYRTRGENKAAEVLATVKEWPVTLLTGDEALTIAAARVKAAHALSYADAYAIAACLLNGATLVTGDPEMKQVEERLGLAVRWI